MTTPTPSAAEIERLAALVEWVTESYPLSAAKTADMHTVASALRTIPALISDADNDRSRYKAQIEGLERERNEARRMLAEAFKAGARWCSTNGADYWRRLDSDAALYAKDQREVDHGGFVTTQSLAAAKEKPDG